MIVAPCACSGRNEQAVEVAQHRGGRTPDEVLALGAAPGHRQKAPLHTCDLEDVVTVMGGVHQKGQGHLEGLGHLEGVEHHFERRLDQTNHRCHLEVGNRRIDRQLANDLDMPSREADLFLGLSQGRRDRAIVVRLDAATGKADLAGVVAQVVGAPSQQQLEPLLALDQRHEHRRTGRLPVREACAVAGELRLPGRHRPQALSDRVRGECIGGHRGQVVIDVRDRHELGLGDGRTRHAIKKQKPPRAWALAALAVSTG
mmetsp:Transcript_22126/g.87070  ORF Transcript_22126/g.87070 Transcript_22126/m.87070 type:complete len:258 (-) Transcript_22126:4993-5766(-)